MQCHTHLRTKTDNKKGRKKKTKERSRGLKDSIFAEFRTPPDMAYLEWRYLKPKE